jgi:hypothetical protein
MDANGPPSREKAAAAKTACVQFETTAGPILSSKIAKTLAGAMRKSIP